MRARRFGYSGLAVSLFSGAGGLDIGVERAGFWVAASVERDSTACKTLTRNFANNRRTAQGLRTEIFESHIEDCSVAEVLRAAGAKRGHVDLLVGGPPCTPFSKSGYWLENKRTGRDPDRFLLEHYVRFVRGIRPRAFIMENVHGLAYDNHNRRLFNSLRASLVELGYSITEGVLNAADFGVPQIRQRLFLIGARRIKPQLPFATYAAPNSPSAEAGLLAHITSGAALDGVESSAEDEELVGGRYGHLLPEIAPGGNYLHFTAERGHPAPLFRWRSRYWTFLLKLDPAKPSSTIQAQPGPYVGPFHWENRRLRVPELKRLQSFPDDYVFDGNRRAIQSQIGNAVPPLMGEIVATEVAKCLLDRSAASKVA